MTTVLVDALSKIMKASVVNAVAKYVIAQKKRPCSSIPFHSIHPFTGPFSYDEC